jgi:hypothetical protein
MMMRDENEEKDNITSLVKGSWPIYLRLEMAASYDLHNSYIPPTQLILIHLLLPQLLGRCKDKMSLLFLDNTQPPASHENICLDNMTVCEGFLLPFSLPNSVISLILSFPTVLDVMDSQVHRL